MGEAMRRLASGRTLAACTIVAVSIAWLAVAMKAQTIVDTVKIRGQVVDARTGLPVSSARIRHSSLSPRDLILTDENGSFELSAPISESAILTVDKEGYSSARPEGQRIPRGGSFPAGISLAAGADDEIALLIPLYPSGLVTGKISDDGGNPVLGAFVWAFRSAYDDWGRTIVRYIAAGRTNDLGDFRFELDPGEYRFKIEPPESRMGDNASYYAVYYPFARNPEQAEVMSVAAGGETRLGALLLPSESGGRLRLRIDDHTGQLRAPAIVIGHNGANTSRSSIGDVGERTGTTITVDAGRLAPGTYDVYVAQSSAEARVVASVDVGYTDFEFPITLPKAAELRAQAFLEQSGEPAPAAIAGVILRFVYDSPQAGANFILKTSGADGRFSTPTLAAMNYRVSVYRTPPGLYVKAVRAGRHDVLRDGIDVHGELVELDVILDVADAVVAGVVRDEMGRPVPDAQVAVLPEDQIRTELYTAVDTDSRGGFRIERPAGKYRLYAWRELDGAAYRNDDFMRPYGPYGIDVDLKTNDKQTVSLTVLPY